MKQFMPLITSVLFIVVLIGAVWYEVRSGKPDQSETVIVSSDSNTGLSGKLVNDAATAATTFSSTLAAHGKVPLDAAGIPTNPSPLFVPTKQ